jgi:catechol 2,3-dioxygenase-like lactoylglutathione lyase family enzyme
MFTHVMVGANDLAASKKFYDAVLGAIGLPAGQADLKGRIFYHTKTGSFGITRPIDGNAATHANGGTIGFACASAEQVKAFHDAGVANGGKSIEDPPRLARRSRGQILSCLLARSLRQQNLRGTSRLNALRRAVKVGRVLRRSAVGQKSANPASEAATGKRSRRYNAPFRARFRARDPGRTAHHRDHDSYASVRLIVSRLAIRRGIASSRWQSSTAGPPIGLPAVTMIRAGYGFRAPWALV